MIYIHGVNTRSPEQGLKLARPFERWFAPRLGGGDIHYLPVYWGDLVEDQFRWNLKSRPASSLLGMGGDEPPDPLLNVGAARSALSGLAQVPFEQEVVDDNVLGQTETPAPPKSYEIAKAAPARRGDLIADLYLVARASDKQADPAADLLVEDPRLAALADAAEEVAGRWDELVDVTAADPENAERLVEAVEQQLDADDLIAAGAIGDLATRAKEAASRLFALPGNVVSSVLSELRPTVNAFVANFLGDVLTYLHSRDRAGIPAEIPQRMLDALSEAQAHKKKTGAPIIVVTHSMGGQLFYDAITHYAGQRADLADLEIDHWFSCGSQVSFFAELGLFRGQDPAIRAPQKLSRPAAVKHWVNFYDTNDLVGFAMKEVFDGVEDQEYLTGYGLALAHTGYLARPSFFRAMADRL